jgi:uncharacterized membrane protein YecN with MAPEG domain
MQLFNYSNKARQKKVCLVNLISSKVDKTFLVFTLGQIVLFHRVLKYYFLNLQVIQESVCL